MGDNPRAQLAKNAVGNSKAKNAAESGFIDTNLGGQVPIRDFSVNENLVGNIEVVIILTGDAARESVYSSNNTYY